MTKPSDFIYTTYIKSTPEKVWAAITNSEFTRQYWGHNIISDWKKGSEWKLVTLDEKMVKAVGEVLESLPPQRLVLSWAKPDNKTDGSRAVFEIEAVADMVCLRVVHGDFKAGSDLAGKVSQGWPLVLSGLKSFLETGKPLDISWAANSCGGKAA